MRAGIALVCSLVLLASTGPRAPVTEAGQSYPDMGDRIRATDKALRWLFDHQNTDGGFGEPASDPQTTCQAVLAFASAYEEPGTIHKNGHSPLDYLGGQIPTYADTAEGAAYTILAVVAGNRDPREFGGTDLIETLEGYRDGNGRYYEASSDGIAAQALAMLALAAAKEAVPAVAVTWLKDQQNPADDGWGSLPQEASDTTHTALSIQALIAAGESAGSQAVRDAVLFLQPRQMGDAGFSSSASASDSDAASTCRAIQALLAAGEDLYSSAWNPCLLTPFGALLDAQAGGGSFESDLELTAVAVQGLMGRSLPLPGRYVAALRALEWLHGEQLDDGGFGNGGITADAVYAIALCGQDPSGTDWEHPVTGKTPLEALEVQAEAYINGAPAGGPAGELSKVIRAVKQAEGDPYNFASMDLVGDLQDLYDSGTGRYHPSKVYSHDLAVIALNAVTETIPNLAVTTLESSQLGSGGWPWAWGATTADVDSTGLSTQAIVAGGGPSTPAITEDAADFLDSLRFPNGSYPDLATKTEPNCDSTSLAIQGLLASGRYRQEPFLFILDTGAASSSWDGLLAFQEPAGSFVASASVPESRLMATLEAVHALASPLYPAYQPLDEVDGTTAGTVFGRLTCGHGFAVVAPYSGDDDNDGSASLRYHRLGETEWNGPTDMAKRGLHYLDTLDLESGTGYEIQVTYIDSSDGVSGVAIQSLSIYVGKACIPMALRSYAG